MSEHDFGCGAVGNDHICMLPKRHAGPHGWEPMPMSSIDRDALIVRIAEAFETAKQMRFASWANTKFAEVIVDAILPAVEQAIRAAEQRGREQAGAEVLALAEDWDDHDEKPGAFYPEAGAWADGVDAGYMRAADELRTRLARGGSTDEEQTP